MKQPAQLVFIPAPGIGHIVSTVEIAKALVSRDDGLFVTVLIMKLPDDKHFTTTDSVSERINLVNLPETLVDPQAPGGFTGFIRAFVENHRPHVKDAVTKLLTVTAEAEKPAAAPPRLAGFVVDMFCTPMIDEANEFGVPSYVFFTSSAATLGMLLHLQRLRDEEGKDVSDLIDSGAHVPFPSYVNPLPIKVFPSILLDKEGATNFLNFCKRFRETKGILVNTFSELESHAIGSFSHGRAPPVYPVGPLLNLRSDEAHVLGSDKSTQKSDILKWLDDQPPMSVLFLCFGSMGSFGEAQVKEIACALEQSGARFVWSLRQPPSDGGMLALPRDYADPAGVLPEGFLDRTAEIGKVIGWAPQVSILAHPTVGGFVSHCGWNSTLESLWYGVPVAAWPLYAEQQLNAFAMVKELGLAVEVKIDYRKDDEMLVSAEEIESAIRKVMEKDSEIRDKVKELSGKSKQALMVGGSSYLSLGRFLDQI